MNKKKKIAICFFGETRAPGVINKIYKSIENKYDYFISTWDDEESQKLDFKFITKKLLNFNKIWNKELNPYERQYWGKEKNIHKKSPNQIFATYHIKRVLELKKQYEIENNFKYDLVVLIRPDIITELDVLEKHFDNLLQLDYLKRAIVSLQGPLDMCDRINRKTIGLVKDYCYIVNSAGADLLSSWFDDFYVHKKDYDMDLPCVDNHSMAAFPFVYYNFLVLHKDFKKEIIRRNRDNSAIEQFSGNLSYKELLLAVKLNRKKWIVDKNNNHIIIHSETGVKLDKKCKVVE